MGLVDKLFGNKSEKEIKRIEKYVDAIEALDEKMQALSDEELRAKTQEFKDRLAAGETLDDLLVEAFAVVREAADRTIHLKHYRVQLMGGIILHQGRIAEMKTGEGKTLVSTLPAYLNALEGKGVHIVTVNDYLAKRDANWMGQVHQFLGLSVGVILNSYDNAERQAAYNCDITYITNNELGSMRQEPRLSFPVRVVSPQTFTKHVMYLQDRCSVVLLMVNCLRLMPSWVLISKKMETSLLTKKISRLCLRQKV